MAEQRVVGFSKSSLKTAVNNLIENYVGNIIIESWTVFQTGIFPAVFCAKLLQYSHKENYISFLRPLNKLKVRHCLLLFNKASYWWSIFDKR